uniref:Uncharacterized protein n=1 Tax=Megaselia scalaris TaxID=36166 RepID=T1H597_MEGSC
MIQELVTIFASVGFIGYLIYLYFTWNFNYWKAKGVQGPEPVFFKGNFPNIVSREENMVYDIDDIYNLKK